MRGTRNAFSQTMRMRPTSQVNVATLTESLPSLESVLGGCHGDNPGLGCSPPIEV